MDADKKKIQPSADIEEGALRVVKITRNIHAAKLCDYKVSPTIKRLTDNNFQHTICFGKAERKVMKKIDQLKETGLTVENYTNMLSILIEIEDFACQKKHGCLTNTKLRKCSRYHYLFEMDFNEKLAASIRLKDNICVALTNHQEQVDGIVVEIDKPCIIFQCNPELEIREDSRYNIYFIRNRITERLEHTAVERVKHFQLTKLLFPTAPRWQYMARNESMWLLDKRISENAEQVNAVRAIVNGVASHEIPFLLGGMTGSGKTQVLVECIIQLWLHQPTTRILVCATTNDGIDEIGMRLLDCFRRLDTDQPAMMRIFRASRLSAETPFELQTISKVFEHETPAIIFKMLHSHRIVLSTLSAAGWIARVKLQPDYFTHLFIDECESARETMQLIPIAGVCSSMGKIHPRVILSGDTQQLGSFINSPIAKQLNLGVSMLERLSHNPIYDTLSENLHSTMLVKNYRTHHMILKPPNDLFYQGKMESCGSRPECDLGVGLLWLPAPRFPLFVEHVSGFAQQEADAYSWYNLMEVNRVVHYVEMVLLHSFDRFQQKDVGIITPSKNQCVLISNECLNRGWPNIKVGTAERFTGQERPVVIVSTVMTRETTLGCLDDPKRINVMLTRASALLIVIGDTEILARNLDWRYLIVYCRENSALVRT